MRSVAEDCCLVTNWRGACSSSSFRTSAPPGARRSWLAVEHVLSQNECLQFYLNHHLTQTSCKRLKEPDYILHLFLLFFLFIYLIIFWIAKHYFYNKFEEIAKFLNNFNLFHTISGCTTSCTVVAIRYPAQEVQVQLHTFYPTRGIWRCLCGT